MPIAAIHIHGYRTDDYRDTVGQLDQLYEEAGVVSRVLVYDADNVAEARRMNPDTARRLKNFIIYYRERGYTTVVTAHSNGNTILRMCYDHYEVSPDIAVCIQPALPSDIHPSPDAKHTTVYWNPEDRVVKFGRILTWITSLFSEEWAAARNWGEMGRTGYTGSELNIESINTADKIFPRRAVEHSGIFEHPSAGYWMEYIFKTSYARALSLSLVDERQIVTT